MDQSEASRVCDEAIEVLLRGRLDPLENRDLIDELVAKLLPRLGPGIANSRARELSVLMVREWNKLGEYLGAGGITTRKEKRGQRWGGHDMIDSRIILL